MSIRRPETGIVLQLARANAEDRQRALDEVCRSALKDFVGRKVTPYVLEQAKLCLRNALDEAIRAGVYVLPDGLTLSHVELGPDMRLKVFFGKVDPAPPSVLGMVPDVGEPAEEEPRSKLGGRFEAVAAELDNTNNADDEEPT